MLPEGSNPYHAGYQRNRNLTMHNGLNNPADPMGQNLLFNTTNDVTNQANNLKQQPKATANNTKTSNQSSNQITGGVYADKTKVHLKKQSISGSERRDRPPSSKKDGRGSSAKRGPSAKRADSKNKNSEAKQNSDYID